MRKATLFSFVLLCFLSLTTYAQNGTVRGSVIDDATGEPLMGVTVVVEGTTSGAATDFDGKFELTLASGTYNLQVSFISYQKISINGVMVKNSEVTLVHDIRMKEDVAQLSEVVVTAEALKTTEEALLTVKRKSANLLDGITAASFRKIGDSDAASAAKRITGVSIEGGKYLFVRGLGDRYTKSILNGVDIPGLDPDRNTLQLDIFPTNIIDNILVMKSFTADLPSDFTGGVVDIQTKEFPDEKLANISIGFGYNPSMHFNKNYLTYEGGDTDFLGFDDGSRDIPTGRSTDIPLFSEVVGDPTSEEGLKFRSILESFNPTMAAMKERSLMDFNIGASLGNQIVWKKNTWGYNFSISYKNNTEYYEDAEYGNYGLLADPTVNEMEPREFQKGNFGVNNVLLGGLAGVALKRERSKYRLDFLHLQNGESKAGIFDFQNTQQGAIFTGFQHNLEYSERGLTNILLNGEHFNRNGRWKLEWKISPTRSKITDPDVRFTRYEYENNGLRISTEAGFPQRIWRFLEENNLVAQVGATKDYNFRGSPANVRFGVGNTYKQRDFEIQIFDLNIRRIELTGDPNELFHDDNLWPVEGNASKGTTYEPQFIPSNPNLFDATVNNSSAYVSTEFSPFIKLKAILGLRAEKYVQRYTGQDQLGINVLDDEVVLDMLDFFPSVNLIYSIKETQNLRFSYSKTIARPSFKEMSYAEIFDPLTNRTFVGGLFRDANDVAGIEYWDGNLRETNISNFDVRWEIFQQKGQMFSISGFYKTFENPIEVVQFATQPGAFQPRNVGDGQVIGAEIEFRKNLGFIDRRLENLSFNGNFTVTDSRIEMNPTEFNSRVENAREGDTIDRTRDMAGQAPYIINAGFSYDGKNNGLDIGIFYNVQGETLQFVGIVDRPDVYSVPFHSLNFSANKTFGADEKIRAGFKVSNLLGDKKESVYQSFGAQDRFFSTIAPATELSVSLGYTF